MMVYMEEDAGRTQKAKLEIARTHVDKPQCFGENVETKLELFSPPTSAHCLQKEKWSFKGKKSTVPTVKHGGGMFFVLGAALLHLAQRTLNLCRAEVSRLPKHPGVKHIAECQRAQPESEVTGSNTQKYKNGWGKKGLFLNGSPWAKSLILPKDLQENLKIAVLRRHPETAWAAHWGKVSQTTCLQMQISHCEVQRSLIGNDIKLRVPSFWSMLIL